MAFFGIKGVESSVRQSHPLQSSSTPPLRTTVVPTLAKNTNRLINQKVAHGSNYSPVCGYLRQFFPKLLPKEAVEYEVESSDGLQ